MGRFDQFQGRFSIILVLELYLSSKSAYFCDISGDFDIFVVLNNLKKAEFWIMVVPLPPGSIYTNEVSVPVAVILMCDYRTTVRG